MNLLQGSADAVGQTNAPTGNTGSHRNTSDSKVMNKTQKEQKSQRTLGCRDRLRFEP